MTTRIPFYAEGYKVKNKHQNMENCLRMDYPLEGSPTFRQEIQKHIWKCIPLKKLKLELEG